MVVLVSLVVVLLFICSSVVDVSVTVDDSNFSFIEAVTVGGALGSCVPIATSSGVTVGISVVWNGGRRGAIVGGGGTLVVAGDAVDGGGDPVAVCC